MERMVGNIGGKALNWLGPLEQNTGFGIQNTSNFKIGGVTGSVS